MRLLVGVVTLAFLMSGCIASVRGGGWGESALQEGAKATAALSMRCKVTSGSSCIEAAISGNYQDRGVAEPPFEYGVRLAFDGVARLCSQEAPDAPVVSDVSEPLCAAFAFGGATYWLSFVSYRSLDKRYPGTGCAVLTVTDNQQNGLDKDDSVGINIDQEQLDDFQAFLEDFEGILPEDLELNCTDAGPYDGYSNSGHSAILGGNLNIVVTTTTPPG